MNIDTSHFKAKLEEEKKTLEKDLQSVASVDSKNPDTWDAETKDAGDEIPSDRTETADAIESYELNMSIASKLQQQLHEVNNALKRIGAGTYGICRIGGEPIEADRLEANPSASTCKQHMNDPL